MSKLKTLMETTRQLKSGVKGELGGALVGIEEHLKEIAKLTGISIKENKELLNEAAPIGSFQYISQKINATINDMDSFDPDGDGDNDKYNCYVVALFPDRVVLECGDGFYEMTYSIDSDGDVDFGDPIEVEQYFTATESAAFKVKNAGVSIKEKELRESGVEITKAATEMDFDQSFNCRIKEGSFDADTGAVDIIIIEAGTNPHKKRHYPISTIKEAAPLFRGMKMYLNHPTEKEERERPERDIKDWVSTIEESAFQDGNKAVGKAYIHDPWLRERMADPVFSRNIGLSINTGGRVSYGKINGEEMQIVEKIHPNRSNGPGSVDWVTEAGARGRVVQQLKESVSQNKENEMKQVGEMTLEEFKEAFPAVYKNIQESGNKKSVSDDKDAKLAEANRVIEEQNKKLKLIDQKAELKKLLKESKVPDIAKDRIMDDLSETLFESEEKLKEAVKVAVEKELKYLNSFSSKGKISVPAGGKTIQVKENRSAEASEVLQESSSALEKRFGIKAKKDDDGDDD